MKKQQKITHYFNYIINDDCLSEGEESNNDLEFDDNFDLDWREIRQNCYFDTMEEFKKQIDTALPNINEVDHTYMTDFYDESELTSEWLSLSNNKKKEILDEQLKEYFLKKTNC